MQAVTLLLEFAEQQKVYLVTDPNQCVRIVTGYRVNNGSITYELSCGAQVSYHYAFEISESPVTC